jgi:hypothetical protein
MNSDESRLLGEIKGKLDLVIDGQAEQREIIEKKLDGLDARLRKVENKAALNGAVAGGIISVGMAIAIEKLKTVIGVS